MEVLGEGREIGHGAVYEMTYMGTRARVWSMEPECWCFSGRSISRGASLSMGAMMVVVMVRSGDAVCLGVVW